MGVELSGKEEKKNRRRKKKRFFNFFFFFFNCLKLLKVLQVLCQGLITLKYVEYIVYVECYVDC